MMIAEGFTCQRYGFNVGADKFSLLTIENGKTSIMRLSEWTLISQSQKSHSDRLLGQEMPPPAVPGMFLLTSEPEIVSPASTPGIPETLRSRRKAKGLSQIKLAEVLGVSVKKISAWEHGKSVPTAEEQKKLDAFI